MTNAQLSNKWVKASVPGTIWAASEIVLGSFLHNLKIPFSGNVLTALALILLITASYKWQEKGLFWRAGVIAALLKTMSPSAVIFGPMVAIISEGLLIEASTRLLGRTIPGFIAASILAMSWNLIQKIANFIIFYGFDIVELYESLMQYAEKQLGRDFNAVWLPILILLSIQIVFGIIAGIAGIYAGKSLNETKDSISFERNKTNFFNFKKDSGSSFSYSSSWMAANTIFFIGLLVSGSYLSLYLWSVLVAGIVSLWAVRYKRALRQLLRPKFWIFFVLITMLTAYVFAKMKSGNAVEGLLTGIEMNLRAILVITGFTVLGTELYNPHIRKRLANGRFNNLSLAVELSLESLPNVIASLPDAGTLIRRPIAVIKHIVLQADEHLKAVKEDSESYPKLFIVTGSIGDGKTTFIKQLHKQAKAEKLSIAGFYSERIMQNDETTGYNITDAGIEQSTPFLRITENREPEKIGKFSIKPEGLKKGREILRESSDTTAQLIVIDEIGRLELQGRGWAKQFERLLTTYRGTIVLSVRDSFIQSVTEKFRLNNPEVIKAGEDKISKVLSEAAKTKPTAKQPSGIYQI